MTVRRELTVRGPGGSVRGEVGTERARRDFIGNSGVRTILIHGFANPVRKARQSYGNFCNRLSDVLYPNVLSSATSIWEFNWPGNHPRDPMNSLTYSARVEAADSSGEKLGELIVELEEEDTVILIAHSMGCRVALSAVRRLLTYEMGGGPRHRKGESAPRGPNVVVFLLAAAVPVSSCELSNPLEEETEKNRLERLWDDTQFGWRRSRTSYIVLYSGHDLVLRLCFPFGQFAHSQFSQAVGLRAGPDYNMEGVRRWDKRVSTGIGHKHYWNSHLVAGQVIEYLHPGWRRYMAKWSASAETRELVSRTILLREIERHSLATR